MDTSTAPTAMTMDKRASIAPDRSIFKRASGSFKKFSLKFSRAKARLDTWDAVKVAQWLDIIGLGLYSQSFTENGVNGSILLDLSDHQMDEGLGVGRSEPFHILSLRIAIIDLLEKNINYNDWQWDARGVQEWLVERGLAVLLDRFRSMGVHGGVLFNQSAIQFQQQIGVNSNNYYCGNLLLKNLMLSIERAREVCANPKNAGRDNILDWGPKQVKEWLHHLHLLHLYPKLKEAHITNGTMLLSTDADELTQLVGLTEIQSMVIIKAIGKLHKKHRNSLGIVRRGSMVAKKALRIRNKSNNIPVASEVNMVAQDITYNTPRVTAAKETNFLDANSDQEDNKRDHCPYTEC